MFIFTHSEKSPDLTEHKKEKTNVLLSRSIDPKINIIDLI